jgi:hypothetical protein
MTESPRGNEPPGWMAALLTRLLRPRDRDVISGDLFEAYNDAIVSGQGRPRAAAHYIVQAGSVILVALRPPTRAGVTLVALCAVSIAGLAWLMLGSPNPAVPPVAVAFIAQGLVTVAVIGRAARRVRRLLLPGAVAVALGGSLALSETLVWAPFDWKVAVTGAALLVQGTLTVALLAGCLGGLGPRTDLP